MAGFIAVKLDVSEAVRDINQYAEDAQKRVRESIGKAAVDIQAKARQYAPVDNGELRGKITVDPAQDADSIDVVAHADHSAFVEYGTGTRGATAAHPELPPDYQHGGGTKHEGEWPGMAAQPYMHPAAEEVRPEFIKNVQEAVKKNAA